MSAPGVTAQQRAAAEFLAANPGRWTAADMLRHLYQHHNTTQGVTQTVASLVRRGYVAKHTSGRHITYSATPKGAELVRALRSLDRAR